MSEVLYLVTAADERFAMPLAVSICSALRHCHESRAVEVSVLDGGLSGDSKKRLESLIQRVSVGRAVVRWIVPPPATLPNLSAYRFSHTSITAATFLRFAVSAILPEACERAIYFDPDVVIRADMAELADSLIPNRVLMAVRDFGMPTVAQRRFPEYMLREYGDPSETTLYFNAGVLAINVRLWRSIEVGKRCCEVVQRHAANLRFNDQDALNLVLLDQTGEVDLGWNVQTGGPDRIKRLGATEEEFLGEPYQQIRRRAKIIHFTGNKPWAQGFTNPDRPAFVKALRASGWLGPIGFRKWQLGWWSRLAVRATRKRLLRAT